MPFEYELPDVGEGVAEGEIVAWHVDVGDHVAEDEVLAEIETDKAVVDLPSPVAGTIRELHAEAGDVVPVGSVVVTIDTDGEAEAVEAGGEGEAEPAQEPAEEAAAAEPAAAADATTDGEAPVAEGRVFAPPNVRRLARELGVEIAAVEGSGPSGRVTEGDVRAAAEAADEPDEAPSERKSAVSRRGDGERKSATRRRSDDGATASAEAAGRDRTLAVPATRHAAREAGVDIDEVPTEKERDGEAVVEPEDIERYVSAQEASAQAGDGTTETVEAEQTTAEAGETTVESTAEGAVRTESRTAEFAGQSATRCSSPHRRFPTPPITIRQSSTNWSKHARSCVSGPTTAAST